LFILIFKFLDSRRENRRHSIKNIG
jgi:hypothetical protein